MNELGNLERDFQNFLLGQPSGIEGLINQTEKASRDTLLAVYRDGYGLRLLEVLSHNYPKLAQLLGEHEFAALARAYVATHPSRHFNARWYGHALASFLKHEPAFRERPALADLAAFEWTLAEAFDGPDDEPLGVEAMAALPPEQWPAAHFRFHPTLQSLSVASEAIDLWQRLDSGEAIAKPMLASAVARTWLVWRRELTSQFRSIEADEEAALALARTGGTFGGLCELLADQHGEAAAGRGAQILAQWFADGVIVGLGSAQSED